MCRYFPVGRGGVRDPPNRRIVPRGDRIVQTRAAAACRKRPSRYSPGADKPVARLGTAPASVAAADISASPPEVCWPGSLVTPDQREVCPLSRQGDVATPIRPITGRHSLPPSSFTCCPVGAPCGLLSLDPIGYGTGRTTGLPRSADVPEWIGRISTPVARHLRRRSSGPPDLATYLLVQAVQQLALVLCDDAYDALPGLAIPLDPGSRPPLLLAVAVAAHALAALPRPHVPIRGGYVVPALVSRYDTVGRTTGAVNTYPSASAQLHRRPRVAPERRFTAATCSAGPPGGTELRVRNRAACRHARRPPVGCA